MVVLFSLYYLLYHMILKCFIVSGKKLSTVKLLTY